MASPLEVGELNLQTPPCLVSNCAGDHIQTVLGITASMSLKHCHVNCNCHAPMASAYGLYGCNKVTSVVRTTGNGNRNRFTVCGLGQLVTLGGLQEGFRNSETMCKMSTFLRVRCIRFFSSRFSKASRTPLNLRTSWTAPTSLFWLVLLPRNEASGLTPELPQAPHRKSCPIHPALWLVVPPPRSRWPPTGHQHHFSPNTVTALHSILSKHLLNLK